MSVERRDMGIEGERLAENFLRQRGISVVARRYNTPVGEIDLIARDKDTLVFVEVKCRGDENWTEPQFAVNAGKRRKMTKAARYFINERKVFDKPCRFDVIAIVLPEVAAGDAAAGPAKTRPAPPKITHFPNAFLPDRW